MMRCLRLSSLVLVLLAACASPYKKLIPITPGDPLNIENSGFSRYKPSYPGFQKALYRCHVNGRFLFKEFHLSGILFFKNLEDGTTRVVFSNEMGYTFFDFAWDAKDSFHVSTIIPQLDRPAVIRALRRDVELLLVRNLRQPELFLREDTSYYRFRLPKDYAYYIVHQTDLKRIEVGGKRTTTTIFPIGKRNDPDMPDSISIIHHRANFTINAKKIRNAAAE